MITLYQHKVMDTLSNDLFGCIRKVSKISELLLLGCNEPCESYLIYSSSIFRFKRAMKESNYLWINETKDKVPIYILLISAIRNKHKHMIDKNVLNKLNEYDYEAIEVYLLVAGYYEYIRNIQPSNINRPRLYYLCGKSNNPALIKDLKETPREFIRGLSKGQHQSRFKIYSRGLDNNTYIPFIMNFNDEQFIIDNISERRDLNTENCLEWAIEAKRYKVVAYLLKYCDKLSDIPTSIINDIICDRKTLLLNDKQGLIRDIEEHIIFAIINGDVDALDFIFNHTLQKDGFFTLVYKYNQNPEIRKYLNTKFESYYQPTTNAYVRISDLVGVGFRLEQIDSNVTNIVEYMYESGAIKSREECYIRISSSESALKHLLMKLYLRTLQYYANKDRQDIIRIIFDNLPISYIDEYREILRADIIDRLKCHCSDITYHKHCRYFKLLNQYIDQSKSVSYNMNSKHSVSRLSDAYNLGTIEKMMSTRDIVKLIHNKHTWD